MNRFSKTEITFGKAFKETFKVIFLLMTLSLALFPFFTTFSDALTRFVLKFGLFAVLKNITVPIMTKGVVVVLSVFGIQAQASESIVILQKSVDILPFKAEVLWNCVGWQTAILLFLTFFVGLSGPFNLKSKVESLIIGVLGTFLFSLFRLSFIFILGYYFGRYPALIFHNYFSTLFSFAWIFIFWWFVYSFVLVEKRQTSVVE